MPETHFGEWIARRYARLWPELFEPTIIEATVDFLQGLAGPGPVLEFGIGSGRVALPLSRRGVRVCGVELSPAMVDELRRQDAAMPVTVGDFATAKLDGTFSLVYLLRNAITNLTTQDEQIEAFGNAAAHLRPGGCFVIEHYVPALQRLAPGETTDVFVAPPDHVGLEEYDLGAQLAVSRHFWVIDGELKTFASLHRYVWPSELDLMARVAGMTLRECGSDWLRTPFTGESRNHISVWAKPA